MRGWNYDVIEGKATASRIAAAANTLPMMGERRMVLVRDLATLGAEELGKLVEYLDSPSPSTVLVALTSKLDKRLKFYSAAAKKKWLHVLEAPRHPAPWIRLGIIGNPRIGKRLSFSFVQVKYVPDISLASGTRGCELLE